MNKLVIPTYYAKSLFEVDVLFFVKNNIHFIFTDLDNTLDSFKQKEPTEKVITLKEKLLENNPTENDYYINRKQGYNNT